MGVSIAHAVSPVGPGHPVGGSASTAWDTLTWSPPCSIGAFHRVKLFLEAVRSPPTSPLQARVRGSSRPRVAVWFAPRDGDASFRGKSAPSGSESGRGRPPSRTTRVRPGLSASLGRMDRGAGCPLPDQPSSGSRSPGGMVGRRSKGPAVSRTSKETVTRSRRHADVAPILNLFNILGEKQPWPTSASGS
jgi:hypothetical protein